MSADKKRRNPGAFIAIGVCFMGAGVALNAALQEQGAVGAGTGLIGVGVVFLVIGAVQKRRSGLGGTVDEDDDQRTV